MGEVAVACILDERKNGEFFSFSEFLSRRKSAINKRVIESLILAGAFDEIEEISSPRQRVRLLKDLYKHLKLKSFPYTEDPRSDFWYIIQQKELCGLGYLSYDQLVAYTDIKFLKGSWLNADEIDLSINKGKEVLVGGFIFSVTEKNSKRGAFAEVVFHQNDESFIFVFWSDEWIKYSDLIKNNIGKIAYATGKIERDKWKKTNVVYSTGNTAFSPLLVDFSIKLEKE